MHLLQARLIDVRVDLRRRDARMAEEFLHLPQIGTAGEHVRRKTMTERMGTDRRWGAAAEGVFFYQFPNRFPPQALAGT